MGVSLYPTSSSSLTSLWPQSSGDEIDLRQEFHDFLYGSTTEVAKGQPAIFRRMRRDNNGDLVRCDCVDAKTGEPDQDTPCPYCWGEGYLWDEEWVTIYKALHFTQGRATRANQREIPGMSNIPRVYFYLESYVMPTHYDKIIEVPLDEDGELVIPYRREASYPLATPEAFRSDRGRVEYWRCAVVESSIRSTWTP